MSTKKGMGGGSVTVDFKDRKTDKIGGGEGQNLPIFGWHYMWMFPKKKASQCSIHGRFEF